MKKAGRPRKTEESIDSRSKIVDATVALVKSDGASALTVRRICREAGLSIGSFYHCFENMDDLMMYFVREEAFGEYELKTELTDISGRICELYMVLINKYKSLGKEFMYRFYTTDNKALSAYMGYSDDSFPEGTIMERSEQELEKAAELGVFRSGVDLHSIAADICTIVKGTVFEWCLKEGSINIQEILERIIYAYMSAYLA